ncbi:MAG: hypothetical protein IJU68_00630 [Bacteroidales bacterium]|nr:hypothetical protein [Bacteroidales bacterium]
MSALLSILLPLILQFTPQTDSLVFAKLDTMLTRYTEAIVPESVDVKKAECDFLISSVNDSTTTQHVALWLYDHYKDSPVMGEEAVAIHLWDNWFKPGTIKMRSEYDRFDAELFANFNRSTLLGMSAPVVTMQKPCGGKISIPQEGSFSILFFFDTSCGKCKLEAAVMPQVLENITFPARFYAIYCGHDKKEWRRFRSSFKVRNRNVKVIHAWDPEIESDYLRLYGVISTPRLYFTDKDREILGRRLEIESLAEIISYICNYYGQAQKQ